MLLSVHAIEGSASAPTAQHQRRRPRMAYRVLSVFSCGTAPPAFSVLASRETATTTVPTRLFHTTP
jgi:hypothetical protein